MITMCIRTNPGIFTTHESKQLETRVERSHFGSEFSAQHYEARPFFPAEVAVVGPMPLAAWHVCDVDDVHTIKRAREEVTTCNLTTAGRMRSSDLAPAFVVLRSMRVSV